MKVDRKEAVYRLKKAYVDARCSLTQAAKDFRCGRRTFLVWCRKLGIEEWLWGTAKIARRDGWFRVPHGSNRHVRNNTVNVR